MSHRSLATIAFAALLAAGSAHAATLHVEVGPNGTQTFSPRNVTIRAGDTVEWTNEAGGGIHNILADDNSFTSGAPAAGPWTFRLTFATTGTFPYYCQPHGSTGGGGMSGSVIVIDSIELAHGSDMNEDLQAAADRYRIGQKPFSSYEVVVDPLAGNPMLQLRRLSGATTNVLQSGDAVSAGINMSQSLRWQNSTSSTVDTDRVQVGSNNCPTNCTASDLYRVRAYDTTLSIPRYNQSGSQTSVIILQNNSSSPMNATIYFWNGAGILLNSPGTATGTIAPKAAFVQQVGAIAGLTGTSGTVTISHTGRYGDLTGKAVAVEPATGFSFDTPGLVRPR